MGGGAAAGTLDMASSSTVSTLMPSATEMRCRSTYGAISRTSSIVAVSRPFRRAFAFTAITRWIIARELTPSSTPGSSAGLATDSDDVPADRVGNLGVLELLAGLVQADDAEQRPDLAEHVRRDALVGEVQHRELGLGVRVVELDLEEEAVELTFGEGEDAFVLVRVLRRDHEKRIGKLVRLAVDRHLALAHRLEQGGLGARRRTVDLVGEEDVREDGAGHEEVLAGADDVLPVELRRRRVRRELDALERRAEHVCDGTGKKGLRASGRALEEDVTVRDGGDEKQFDGTVLADDDLRHLRLRPLAQAGEIVVLLLHHQRHCVSFRLVSLHLGPIPGLATAGPTPLSAAILLALTHIRGRSGLDVVGSPAEQRAEVAGWPRKSTGTKASANKNELALAA